MAITATHLTSGGTTTAASSFNTASITPTANRLVLAFVTLGDGDSNAGLPASLSGNGLTWVEVDRRDDFTSTTTYRTLVAYRAMGASPSAGAVTIDCTLTQNSIVWSIFEVAGVDTTGTNGSGAIVQSVDNAATAASSLTVTLAAFASSNNRHFAGFACAINEALVDDPDYTTIGTTSIGSPPIALITEWRDAEDTTSSASRATGNGNWGGIGIEVKAAVTSQTLSPGLTSQLASAFAPTFTTLATISPGLTSQVATPFAPIFARTVDPGLVSQLATPFDPGLTQGFTLTMDLTSQLATPFDPTLQMGAVTVSPGLTSQLAAAFDPAFVARIAPALSQQLASAFDPTFQMGGVNISPALVSQLATPFAPTFIITVEPGLVSQLVAAFDPLLTSVVTISPGLAQQLAAAFDPSLTVQGPQIDPGLTQQLVSAFDPSFAMGAVTISPTLVVQLITPFGPVVSLIIVATTPVGASATSLTGGASATSLTGGASATPLVPAGASATSLTGGASATEAVPGQASATSLTGDAS